MVSVNLYGYIGLKLKFKQIKREKSANTKRRILLRENEHLQSILRNRISKYMLD